MRLARLKDDCCDIGRLGPYWIFNRRVSSGWWDVPFLPISAGGTRSDRMARLLCHVERMGRHVGTLSLNRGKRFRRSTSPEANDFNLMTGESQKCRGIFITLAPRPLGFKDY